MRIENEIQLDFSDVLIMPQRSTIKSRSEVDLTRTFVFPHSKKSWAGYPVIAANMLTGTFEMAKVLSEYHMMTALHKHHSIGDLVNFWRNETFIAQNHTFYTLGISEKDVTKYKNFCTIYGDLPNFVLVDVANGHMEIFVEFIKKFRQENPEVTLMCGNVVSGSMVEELTIAGADIIKVGIGSGQNCLSRKIAGCGRPQLSTILEAANHAHGLRSTICADGGCTEPADINIAFCAGADFVMLGSMLSGTEECAGEIVIGEDGKKYKKFFGMSSTSAMTTFHNGKAKYKASEGRTTLVPFRGSVRDIVEEIQGATNSCMAYVGAAKLKELTKRATLIRVNNRLNTAFEKYTIGN